ncbi:uncharacterized protein LOC111801026 [Cucurbita pepo subsp. pepo]|uniref:uncharacterized protein LOC111801026 n=1 Tax=Cucurbita pepo subsp. pepo TaxID=3664 RepID=UPI000C9D452C|nr:uncharacterized protein LOC111801026 [Cucurbita pepo subsp. pepo]
MFMFNLDNIHEFVEAASVISTQAPTGVLKFSPQMFSIMATALPPSPRSVLALQIRPQFFRSYTCTSQLEYAGIFLNDLQFTLYEMDCNGFPELLFSSTEPDCAHLTFRPPASIYNCRLYKLPLCPGTGEMDMDQEINCTTFVSIPSDFFHVVLNVFMDCFDYVLVTLTASLARFCNDAGDIVLIAQENQCSIGGVSSEHQIQFQISLSPWVSFRELARRVERVWIYKPNTSSFGIIAAPVGLYSRFLAYVPA